MTQANVELYILSIETIKEHYEQMFSCASTIRKARIDKYTKEKDRLLSTGAGYLLSKYLPEGEIKENKHGKPYLEGGPFFNISHSGEYVVLAISKERDIGVDIEKIDNEKVKAIKYVLSEEEKSEDNIENLFKMWTNKESIIKCSSVGLNDIKRVTGLPLEGEHRVGGARYYTKSMLYKDYALSLSLLGKEKFHIKIIEE